MLRLSHSQLKLFHECKRRYWHKYVAKDPEKDTEIKYLHFGSAMHEVLEDFHSGKNTDWQENIRKVWKKYKLDDHKMDYDTFKLSVVNGITQKDAVQATHTELKIFVQVGTYQFVGYLDNVDTTNHVILDWKSGTYTKQKEEDYKEQLKCYAYLYWRKFDILPSKCVLFFNKGNKPIEYTFTKDQVLEYEQYIIKTGDAIMELRRQGAKDKAEQNFSACHWCGYKYLCFAGNKTTYKFEITLKGNCGFLAGHVTPTLQEGLDRMMKFDLKGKYYMQKAAVERGGGKRPKNYDDIGTVHLYNKNHRMFNIGHLNKVKKILRDFCNYNKAEMDLQINDLRDKSVLEKKLGIMPDKLHTNKELRDYQIEAIEAFIHHGGMGYIEIATGGGKSLVTAELIRMLDTPTLWVIDRKELLFQTRDWFKEYLGIDVGIIGDKAAQLRHVTCATIQTLYSQLKNDRLGITSWLRNINFLIIDEGHHSSATSYQELCKHLPNTKYRLGTTATVKRDDGMDPVMFSLIGPIVYSIDAKALEEKGYLMRPNITFMDMREKHGYVFGQEYHEVYTEAVVDNEVRNMEIVNLLKTHQDKKILVLTTRIEHGEKLMNELFPQHGIKDAFFLHGSVDTETRKKKFANFKEGDLRVLVGTISIFAEGVDIPDLDGAINASANKGEVKTIQVLGRILRMIEGKKEAFYYDFIDNAKFLDKASSARMKTLKDQGHDVKLRRS